MSPRNRPAAFNGAVALTNLLRVLTPLLLLTACTASAAPKPPTALGLVRQEVRTARKLVTNRDPDLRRSGTLALALLADESWEPRSFEDAVETLIQAVDDDDPEVGVAATAAIESLREPATRPEWASSILQSQLEHALRNRRSASRLLAVRCLLRTHALHTEATETLVDLLAHRKPDVRFAAINALSGLRHPEPVALEGTIANLLRSRLRAPELDQQFDAARALWLLGQLAQDTQTITESEAELARVLVTTRSVDLGRLLDICIETFQHPPALPPGNLLPAALRRSTEDQPPEIALRAAVALALLAPPGSELRLASRFHQTLPGYLTHAYPAVRVGVANAIGHYADRLSLGSVHGDPADPIPWRIAPAFRQILTNLFAVPDPRARLRALGQLSCDSTFVAEHPEAFAAALLEGVNLANQETLRLALAPSLQSVWTLTEAEPARTVFLNNLPLWDGVLSQAALPLLERPPVCFPPKAVAEAVLAQAQNPSPGARSAAARTLLHWIQNGETRMLQTLDSPAELLADLATDPDPVVSLGGVSSLIAAAGQPPLSPMASVCRKRLLSLLLAPQPNVRCRFVALVARRTNPSDFAPKLNRDRPSLDPAWYEETLRSLLTNGDPLLRPRIRQLLETP